MNKKIKLFKDSVKKYIDYIEYRWKGIVLYKNNKIVGILYGQGYAIIDTMSTKNF